MNIKDTFTALEGKMSDLDRLLDTYNEAEGEGQRFKAHGLAKDAEKIAAEIEKIAYEMDDSDLEEILQEEADAQIADTVEFLADASNSLQQLVTEYAEISKGEDQLAARRKLKEIQRLGYEIAHVTERSSNHG